MEYPIHPLGHLNAFVLQNLVTADPWTVDIARLRHEKDFLENGLANCVTYLQALRKRQARNDRLLSSHPLPPRKKRKKIQQSKCGLDKEIRNRERDEQAFLDNLRSCKANMYIAEICRYGPTELFSTMVDYASSATQCSYENAKRLENSWKGRIDNAAMSSYPRQYHNVGFTQEVAPEEFNEVPEYGSIAVEHIKTPPPLLWSVTADAIHAPYLQSSLSPVAAAFKPTQEQAPRTTARLEQSVDELNGLSWLDKRVKAETVLGSRETEICASMLGLAICTRQMLERRCSGSWCNTSPQQSPREARDGAPLGRARTNSL